MDSQWAELSRDIENSWCQTPAIPEDYHYPSQSLEHHNEPSDPCDSTNEHFAIYSTQCAIGHYYDSLQTSSHHADSILSPDSDDFSNQVSPFQSSYSMACSTLGKSDQDIFRSPLLVTDVTYEHGVTTPSYRTWASSETTPSSPPRATLSSEQSQESGSLPSSRSKPLKSEESVKRRRAQNCKAQRAFRERKDRLVQTLQRQIEEMRAKVAMESAKNRELDEVMRSLESMLKDPRTDSSDYLVQSTDEWYTGS